MKRRFLIFWMTVGILILLALFYLPGLSRLQELRLEEKRLTRELAQLEQEIQALQEEKERLLKDRDYLEKVIREELGLVRPGETIYKLVPETKSPPLPAPSASGPPHETR